MNDMRTAVLGAIQSGFPIEHDPYGMLASRLGFAWHDVLEAVANLRHDGSIRRIGASFSSEKLGYRSALCALSVPGDVAAIDRAAEIVGSYPQVTHCYLRDDERYNLWFTLIEQGAGGLERLAEELCACTGRPDLLLLPATAIYKIRVDFGPSTRDSTREQNACESEANAVAPFDAGNPFELELVRWAQGDIAGTDTLPNPEPFATAAREMSIRLGETVDEERIIARLKEFKTSGVIRRFGAMVAHRRIGYAFNGMAVWDMPESNLDRVGALLARLHFVSHCYARLRTETWPYSLYAMVHARTQDELDDYIATAGRLADGRPRVLLSTKEYKKSSMRYFE